MVKYRGGISIFELLVYLPCVPLALLLVVRHGIRRSTGWIYVVIFAQVRAGGAITQLLSESHPTNTGFYTAEAILQSLGLNPLMFIALGMLSRVNGAISLSRKRPVSRWTTHGIGALVIGASALCIVGGIDSSNNLKHGSTFKAAKSTKIGIVIFVLSYLFLVATTALTFFHFRASQPPSERRLGYAILASIPFIGIRLIYSLLACFSSNPQFNLLSGSVTIWLFLAVLPEMIVVAFFLAAGYTVERVQKGAHQERVPASESMMMNSRGAKDQIILAAPVEGEHAW